MEQTLKRAAFVLLTLLLVGRVWLFELVSVANDSMAPALREGDVVWVWRGPLSDAQPGAVVLYDDSGVRSLKRVVAGAGQEIEIVSGALYIDGQAALREEAPVEMPRGCDVSEVRGAVEVWGDREGVVVPAGDAPAERVPAAHVYILGDHRAESSDSRQWGPLPEAAVEGVASRVIWSADPCGGMRWVRVGQRVR